MRSDRLAKLAIAATETGRLADVDALVRDLLGPDAANALQRNVTAATAAAVEGERGGLRSLAELLADPRATAAPEPVADRFAWRGRVTLLAAREKDGKSTLASAIIGAVSTGRPFLGASTLAGPVLLLALEEHLADVAGRLVAHDAAPERVFVLDRVSGPFADLEAAVAAVSPVLVVLDSLAAFVEALDVDAGSSSAWTPIMARLARLARDSDAALLLLHHSRKSDGKYRDSSAIGAGVDAILEMATGDEPNVRKLAARGRWAMSGFSVGLIGGGETDVPPEYEIAAGALSLEAHILRALKGSTCISLRELRRRVPGRATAISSAVDRLIANGMVADLGGAKERKLCLPPEDREPVREPPKSEAGSRENPQGHATEPVLGTAENGDRFPNPNLRTRIGNHPPSDPLEADLNAALGGVS